MCFLLIVLFCRKSLTRSEEKEEIRKGGLWPYVLDTINNYQKKMTVRKVDLVSVF